MWSGREWPRGAQRKTFATGWQQHPRYSVCSGQGQLISTPSPGFPQSKGLTASPFPLGREAEAGRRPGRRGGHWHTEGQFCSLGDSGGSWVVSSECRIVPFTKPPCSVVLLGEPGLTKARRGDWQACGSAPAQRPRPLREEACGFLLVPVSRGDGPHTPPPPSQDVGLRPPGLLASSGSSVLLTVGPDGVRKHSPLLQRHPHPLPPSPSQFCSKRLKNL